MPLSARHERAFYTLARLFAVALGLVACAWGAATFPIFWSQISIERIADAIVDRDTFKPLSLNPLLPTVDQIELSNYCRPEAVHSAAIVRLRLAEDALANAQRDVIDTRLGALEDAVRRSLACSPSDPFLWMILAWLDQTRQGFRPEQVAYLRLSYKLGPYEGWIADRRNRLALSIFERLPPDLADAVVHEFAGMVNSQFDEQAIAILTGPGWPIHDRLLAGLKDIALHRRQELAKELYAAGYDVALPGIAPPAARPW
ncbi:MAG: hypothetical protein WB760_28195 [Xanthobacteraceae bacterium]